MVRLLTLQAERVIQQCEAGVYEPHEGSGPLDLLASGMVESATGDLARAKDLLSESYHLLDGQWRTKAGVQLSCAYWRSGELSEASALLDTLPECFESLLMKAIIVTDSDPAAALTLLSRAEQFDVSGYMWGRFHNQRGMCLRLLGEIDRAIIEYEAALYFLDGTRLKALVKNNLGRVLESHDEIDRAIISLDGPHLAKAYDQKALTFLVEQNYETAERYARWAVGLLEKSDRKLWLAECLLTHAKTLTMLSQHFEALDGIRKVIELSEYLDDRNLKLSALQAAKETALSLSRSAHEQAAGLALEISGYKLKQAANILGVSHQALKEFAVSKGLKFKPHSTIITKL